MWDVKVTQADTGADGMEASYGDTEVVYKQG